MVTTYILGVDHPNNIKKGVCIYYKESLGVHEVKLSNLSQYAICESPYRTIKDILVLSTGPQAKPKLKIYYLTLMNFKVKLL